MRGAGAAIGAALGDLFSTRLLPLLLGCLVAALLLTGAAGWAALHWLVPLIPSGHGLLGWSLRVLAWFAGAGVVVLSVLLMPSVSMLIGGVLFDAVARRVEAATGMPQGRDASLGEGIITGLRIGLPAMALNLLALPLAFIPIVNVFAFAWLNGYLMGREYFTLAALRHMSWDEARALRVRASWPVLMVGVAATFVPLVAPLFGASAMTRLVAQLTDAAPAEPAA